MNKIKGNSFEFPNKKIQAPKIFMETFKFSFIRFKKSLNQI